MKVEVTEGRKKFTVIFEKEEILRQLEKLKESYQDDYYVEANTIPEDGKYLSKEEYEKNYDEMIEYVSSIDEERVKDILREFPKKKNGWLNLKNVEYLYCCNNSEYICEWHNTWIYQTLKAKARDDMVLDIHLYEITDTPG